MNKVSIMTIWLMQLLCMLVEVSGQSPCPQYFTYITDPSTNEIMGQVQIPSPPRNVELHLKVGLSIAVALPTRYVGRLELAHSKEDSVRIVQQGGPLLYRILFPLSRPIPVLTGIWFNDQVYCVGPRAVGPVVTSIVLEHTLYPPQMVPLSQNTPSYVRPSQNTYHPVYIHLPEVQTMRPFFTIPTIQPSRRPTESKKKPLTPRPVTTERIDLSDEIDKNIFLNPNIPQSRPQLQSQPQPSQNNGDCGRSVNTNEINPLISKGMSISPGQWPWLVALFLVKIDFEFQCAGSLVTKRHVITAAHCLKLNAQTNVNIPPSTMLASVGRYRLRDWREAGSVNREIESYMLHPDYTHQGTGDSDLAVLVLRTSVEYSSTIKPVCLWPGPSNLQNVVNKLGFVVGWGRDEFGNPYLAEPRMAKLPIVSQEVCLWSDQRFVSFTSNRTFCAGLKDGSGPCNGDSGSGLVLHDSTTGRYQLRGIVSRSLFDLNEMTCDLTQYVVFVDVAQYMPWINQQISIP
ncbi:PREDICTED: serine protease gd-like isoform X2 [Dinoponera quadriceps]|uniref:Serine protease gd-like isoform X2 n=1 Tax=Dinoponera quadriceps TaxID=609295 RepID=A0A6P3X555_DINQU|nr:PREDICTED: serine protease gd-like isoform X2 [Dinoponera quadriceps]